jgi:REP element-mobilizing transposase RayT
MGLQVPCDNRAQDAPEGHLRADTSTIGTDLPRIGAEKECQILEGHLMPDHVHMCIAIPPKHPVASVIGFLKGKSAIALARRGKERNFSGERFWARGYAVSTVGLNWSRSANTSASSKARMEQKDSSEPSNRRALARRLDF